jgi:hypothetical protein
MDGELILLQREREQMCASLSHELQTMDQLSTIRQTSVLLAELAQLADQITQSLAPLIESKGKTVAEIVGQLTRENEFLQAQLDSLKAMAQSVAKRALALKEKQLAPLLDLLRVATEKTANTDALVDFTDFPISVLDLLGRVDSPHSAVAALAILVNFSSSDRGLQSLAQSLTDTAFPIILKLSEFCHVYSNSALQLTLSLVRNLLRESDFKYQLIRQNCFQLLGEHFKDFDSDIVLAVLDALVQPSFRKTIEHCCRDSIMALAQKLTEPRFIGVRMRISAIIEDEERPVRFGRKRIYA